MIFRPSIKLTLALLALSLVFARLGAWQIDRWHEKEALFHRFENAPEMRVEAAMENGVLFARVEAYGQYDPERHVLLDNRIFNGRAGVNVLTPFRLADGRELLVNRGWLPLPLDRLSLPDVPTSEENRILRGILNRPSEGGTRLGQADVLVPDRWPQLVTYLDPDAVAAALGTTLEPWLLQLDPADETGFDGREWKVAEMRPEVHKAYALQWFALSAAAAVIWVALGVRRARRLAGRSTGEEKS